MPSPVPDSSSSISASESTPVIAGLVEAHLKVIGMSEAPVAVKEEVGMEEEGGSSIVTLRTRTIVRRHIVKANPLKHVAHLLRQKLVAANGAPCNMLQVALELHSQSQDKQDTTLRRIYDVVNVCEGAGFLARTGPEPSSELKASDHQRYFPSRRTEKRSLRGGAAIQWVGGSFDGVLGEVSCKDRKLLLEVEKSHIVDRIHQKRKLCDTLSKQVAVLEKLVEENQTQSSNEDAMTKSETSADHSDIYRDLSSLHSLEGFCDVEYLICEPRPKRLHLPFVMLATHPAANVEIRMTGEPPHEVHVLLDQSYCLMDHIQMIKLLPEGRAGNPSRQSKGTIAPAYLNPHSNLVVEEQVHNA